MYDVKSYYNAAKNAVLNIPEMEAKVREATNEDPWGASSTLMQEIAAGTNNFQQFNEIMPTIYSRFMEKEAREWRQIYKALTLLEYLIKHGSERVVDDARAHISTIKMLRNFHYIDEKGKDQGINVRNRANEIASMLSDVDKIRQERRKAKANRNKYQGHEGGAFNTSTGSRYGGFGSDSYRGGGGSSSGFGGGSSGGGGGYGREDDEYRGSGGRSSSGFRDSSNRRQSYDEYEGADDFDEQPPRRGGASSSSGAGRAPAAPPKPPKEQPKPKEVNLFDFDDEPVAAAPAAAPAAAAAPVDAFGDDDFDDFQQAPASPAAVSPAAAPSGGNANLFALLESNKPTATAAAPTPTHTAPAPSFTAPAPAPAFGSPAYQAPSFQGARAPVSPPAAPAPKTGASAFDDLWTTSLGAPSLTPAKAAGNKTIAQMEKEKAESSLWGAPAAAAPSGGAAAKPAASSGLDDLLL
ncbi:hypothetical protein VHUM_01490 [Vanrija humicola]|uniref:ENTH domain-containing protein n=1 Tax=Vanrija humicola TaxID=5417 RepID=A0A7D8Z225_VANHU|nr:hypothetical protein VHUM_01490 [Vanrija humicola]